jgi:FAD/FMN-containing dehydrogenase
MMQRPAISLLESMMGRTCPIDASVLVLLEAESHDRDDLAADRLAQSLAAAINATSVGVTGQPAVAMDDSARASLWSWRDRLTEAINHTAVPVKLDVSVPLGRCAEFVERLHAIALSASIDANAVALHVFGHLGDGNLHVNIVGLLSRNPTDDEQLAAHDAEESVLSLVAELGGSISAEHGIGTAKRWALPLTRTPEELAAFAALKQAFDPLLLLNPTVLLPQRDASDRSSTPVEAS